VRIIRVN